MAYTALYRKWRPTRFSEVRGQDHIVRTLTNQLKGGRIGHAYLFCGTRGTGKTTVAKIFARAVNCEHPVDGSPCNECDTCKGILSGSSVNVVEIDAASNNGVDNIREIREEVKYRPTEGKYRVYIIDEVHMLSTGAFNALLKTLEEPPEYVIFILATTEAHRIPITVLSRCQRYDFKRLSLEELSNQVRDLLDAEGVPAEEGAVRYIARKADGSSRDALSLLEECISFHYGETLTYEKALEALGAVDQTVFSDLLRAVLDYDIGRAGEVIDGLLNAGRDLSQFVTDLTWYLRNLLLIQAEDPGEEVLGVSREAIASMREEAESMDMNRVMRYIRILSELSNQMRYSPSKRVLLEISVMKMMQPQTEDDLESIKDRLFALESGAVIPAGGMARPAGGAGSRAAGDSAARPELQPPREVEVSAAEFEDLQKVQAEWQDIRFSLSQYLRSMTGGTSVSAENGRIVILFRNAFNFRALTKKREPDVEEALRNRFEKQFKVEFRYLKDTESEPKVVLSSHIPGIDMTIEEDGQ